MTPATPSSAFGTSTPCQWIVTPCSMSSLTSVTSTRSPWRTRSSGPGRHDRRRSARRRIGPRRARSVACRAVEREAGVGLTVARAAEARDADGSAAVVLRGTPRCRRRSRPSRESMTLYVSGRRLSHHMSPIQPRAPAPSKATSAISVPRAALRTTLGWRSVSDDGAGRHLRVAVVGSGPAAFYAAGHLLASDDPPVEVDLIERLPTPWGLVRLGVAPDHPNLKTVSRAFERIAERPGFRFFGNVEVGRDVSHEELDGMYDAVVYAVGVAGRPQARDPGRGSPWLVGRDRARRLVQRPPGLPGARVRSLAESGRSSSATGTSRSMSRGCSRSRARSLRRRTRRTPRSRRSSGPGSARSTSSGGVGPYKLRGPRPSSRRWESSREQASTSTLPSSSSIPRAKPSSPRAATSFGGTSRSCASSPRGRLPASLESSGSASGSRPSRSWATSGSRPSRSCRTGSSPTGRAACGRSLRTSARSFPASSSSAASATEASRSRVCRSMRRRGRRRTRRARARRVGRPVPGLYVAGWIKRGPTGVIGTNKKDAVETVDLLLEDARAGCSRAAGAGELARGAARRPRDRSGHVPGLECDRRSRARPRRRTGPPAREARDLGRAPRRGPRHSFVRSQPESTSSARPFVQRRRGESMPGRRRPPRTRRPGLTARSQPSGRAGAIRQRRWQSPGVIAETCSTARWRAPRRAAASRRRRSAR